MDSQRIGTINHWLRECSVQCQWQYSWWRLNTKLPSQSTLSQDLGTLFSWRWRFIEIIYWITSGLKTSVCAHQIWRDRLYLHLLLLLTCYPVTVTVGGSGYFTDRGSSVFTIKLKYCKARTTLRLIALFTGRST